MACKRTIFDKARVAAKQTKKNNETTMRNNNKNPVRLKNLCESAFSLLRTDKKKDDKKEMKKIFFFF